MLCQHTILAGKNKADIAKKKFKYLNFIYIARSL